MIDRSPVPATPDTRPASNIAPKTLAALRCELRFNHTPNPTTAGIRTNPLAEPLMIAAKSFQPFPLKANRCDRNQSSVQNNRPKNGKPINAQPRSQYPIGCKCPAAALATKSAVLLRRGTIGSDRGTT